MLLAKYLSRANCGVAAHRWFEGGMDDVGADSSLGTRENDLEEDRYQIKLLVSEVNVTFCCSQQNSSLLSFSAVSFAASPLP